jgi:hypothetical protein
LVLHGFNSLNNIIVDRDLLVLARESDDELFNTKSNRHLLVLSLPEESLFFDGVEDLLSKLIKVGLVVKRLDFEHHERHRNNNLLLLAGSSCFLSFLCSFFGCSSVFLIIAAKKIKIVILFRSFLWFGLRVRWLQSLGACFDDTESLDNLFLGTEGIEPIYKVRGSTAKALSGKEGLESRDESSTNVDVSERELVTKDPFLSG